MNNNLPIVTSFDQPVMSKKDDFLKVDWSKFIAVNGATAHPHFDPDGTAYNMGNSYRNKG